jgi:hypothetical protein
MPVNDASVGLLPVLLASTHFVSFVVDLSQVAPNGHSTLVSQYTFNSPVISSYVLQDDAGTAASVQIAFSAPSGTGLTGLAPATVNYPSTEPTPTPTAGLSQAPGMPQVAAQDALASQGIAELSLTTGTGTVTNEALTGFSLSVLHLTVGGGTGYASAAEVEVTATMPVDSISATDLLQATLAGTVYKSALITPHNLATNSSYELTGSSIAAQLLQGGASGELVQVVIDVVAGAFQVLSPPTNANLIVNGNFSQPAQVSVPYYETVDASAQNSNGQLVIPGWRVGGNSVDVIGSGVSAPKHPAAPLMVWQPPPGAPSGSQSIDLSGADPGSIAQTVDTTPGASYLLKWYASANPSCGQQNLEMGVWWGGIEQELWPINTTSATTNTTSINGSLILNWFLESKVVPASSARTVLKFTDAGKSLSTGSESPCGPVVADVSLTAEQS